MINPNGRYREASVVVKLGETATLKDYGAVGDNIVDDTNALIAALNSGKTVVIGKGTYRINGSVVYTSPNPISVVAEKGAVLDATGSSASTVLTLGGSRGTTAYTLTSAANVGEKSIVSVIPGVAVGDILLLTTVNASPVDLWSTERSDFYRGETVEVESITGATLTLKSQLNDTYAVSKTTVYKLTMPTVSVQNLEIRRNGNTSGLAISYAKDLVVSGCRISGARDRAFNLSYIHSGVFSNNHSTDNWYTGSATSYALSVGTAQDLTIRENRLHGGRHAMFLRGLEPSRRISLVGNVLDNYHSSGLYALHIGGNCEHVSIDLSLIHI